MSMNPKDRYILSMTIAAVGYLLEHAVSKKSLEMGIHMCVELTRHLSFWDGSVDILNQNMYRVMFQEFFALDPEHIDLYTAMLHPQMTFLVSNRRDLTADEYWIKYGQVYYLDLLFNALKDENKTVLDMLEDSKKMASEFQIDCQQVEFMDGLARETNTRPARRRARKSLMCTILQKQLIVV